MNFGKKNEHIIFCNIVQRTIDNWLRTREEEEKSNCKMKITHDNHCRASIYSCDDRVETKDKRYGATARED